MRIFGAFVVIFTSTFSVSLTDATRCIPYSKFKSDCNVCVCSYTGKEYSCTKYICPSIPYEVKFHVENREDGRVILIPKRRPFEDDDFILTKNRSPRGLPLPYKYKDKYEVYQGDDDFEFSEENERFH